MTCRWQEKGDSDTISQEISFTVPPDNWSATSGSCSDLRPRVGFNTLRRGPLATGGNNTLSSITADGDAFSASTRWRFLLWWRSSLFSPYESPETGCSDGDGLNLGASGNTLEIAEENESIYSNRSQPYMDIMLHDAVYVIISDYFRNFMVVDIRFLMHHTHKYCNIKLTFY